MGTDNQHASQSDGKISTSAHVSQLEEYVLRLEKTLKDQLMMSDTMAKRDAQTISGLRELCCVSKDELLKRNIELKQKNEKLASQNKSLRDEIKELYLIK